MSAGAVSLDDTLHAVVRLTHEHGAPLRDVTVWPGQVLVSCEPVDLRWWVAWLTAVTGHKLVAWRKDDETVVVHLLAVREGITWSVCQSLPAAAADPVLADQGVTVTENHDPIASAVVIALTRAGGERS